MAQIAKNTYALRPKAGFAAKLEYGIFASTSNLTGT
jgi:hypothetical protein